MMAHRITLVLLVVCGLACDRRASSTSPRWGMTQPTWGHPQGAWAPPPAPRPPTPSDEPIPTMLDTSFVETPKPKEPARTSVEMISAGAKDIRVTLTNEARQRVWQCERPSPPAGERLDAWCPMPTGWAKAGLYTVSVAHQGDEAEQVVRVQGDELAIEVRIAVEPSVGLTVTRVRPAPSQFRLERRFAKPWHPGLALSYAFVNGDAAASVEAEAVKGHFLGVLERKSTSGWVPHGRGVSCDVSHGTDKLAPGASAMALEGHFVGELRPLIPGTYRFRLRFRDAGATSGTLIEAYEARDEIYVSKSTKRPQSTGVDCDSPFAIDRWGLRRMKPECL